MNVPRRIAAKAKESWDTLRYACAAIRYQGASAKLWGRILYGARAFADAFFADYEEQFAVFYWQPVAERLRTVVTLMPLKVRNTTTLADDIAIATLCRLLEPQRVLEIGTFLGHGTRVIFLNTGEECRIVTLDLPHEDAPDADTTDRPLVAVAQGQGVGRFVPDATRVRQVHGDSTRLDWKEAAQGSCDLVIIDGSHSLLHAASDTRNALGVVSENGAIVWHDAWFRSYGYYSERYRVQDAIRQELSPEQRSHVFRLAGTNYALYWPEVRRRFPDCIGGARGGQ